MVSTSNMLDALHPAQPLSLPHSITLSLSLSPLKLLNFGNSTTRLSDVINFRSKWTQQTRKGDVIITRGDTVTNSRDGGGGSEGGWWRVVVEGEKM